MSISFKVKTCLRKKIFRGGLLLLATACVVFGCSHSDVVDSPDRPLDTYFKADSTYIGIRTVASNLEVPWEITWGPDNWIWMTEQKGMVSKVNPKTGEKVVMLTLPDVYNGSNTPGLLGMAIEQNQKEYPYVFLLYNAQKDTNHIVLNVVRYTVGKDALSHREKLLEIPGAKHHQGSRIKISPDGKLFINTGDAGRGKTEKNAQNVHSLVGKVLRLNIDGSIPKDNPFPGSPVWAWGFRNPQGLTFGKNGVLYDSMHGPASDDEINIIKKRGNYGWPNVNGYCDEIEEQAFCTDSSLVPPIKVWTPTIAPAGITYYQSTQIPEWKHSLILTTLKDASLHVLHLNTAGDSVQSENVYLKNQYGRLRDVCVSPAGDLYVSTSNRDWKPNPGNGFPKSGDDRIIRLFKVDDTDQLKNVSSIHKEKTDSSNVRGNVSTGAALYKNYCQSCHKADGKGMKGTFPPLAKNDVVRAGKNTLISILLNGKSGPTEVHGIKYDGQMPSFRFLSDKKVAQLLTYIRSNFGNNSSEITKEQVKEVRSSTSGKNK